MFYFIKAAIEGKPTDSCLDLPERIWRQFPQCHPDYEDEETKGGEDSTEV
jgi:hypothetical protein